MLAFDIWHLVGWELIEVLGIFLVTIQTFYDFSLPVQLYIS
jgi:hypothetical protein